MKQIVLRGGAPAIVDVPAPSAAAGLVLVANAASVISTGTERAAVESGGGGGPLPVRALRNPDLVRKALEHLREHGIRETLDLARGVTAPDSPLGYSSAGFVLDTGGMAGFQVGQMVACAGAGRANHAEVVSVPGNLVVPVPEGVPARVAAFTTLGAIALQGVRRTSPTLGERVVVVGLGLLGLITVQLLVAAGCPVLGIEPQNRRRELALELGADRVSPVGSASQAVADWTGGAGADAVVVAAATPDSAVINQAVGLVRRKGRVIPVGDVGLSFERAPLYVREADILISTSYGPGRYDSSYEEGGVDYPMAYVRWTENRNMGEFLRLLASGAVRVDPLIDLERPLERGTEVYAEVNGPSPPLAAVLTYDSAQVGGQLAGGRSVSRTSARSASAATTGQLGVGIIGAGGFVTGVHMPNLKADGRAQVVAVANRGPTSAGDAARLVGGAQATTDWHEVIGRGDVDLVIVGTRHDSHAEIATAALEAGKSVFVEKPLGLTREEIDGVWEASRKNDRLAIGFNRPLSPLARTLEQEVREAAGPLHVVYRVSSPLAAKHWLNDPVIGGGRILGEACHMYDFVNWLCGTPIRVLAAALPDRAGVRTVESSSVTISYSNGSVATVHYSGVGSGALPKERIEVLSGGRSWVLEDFVTLTSYGAGSPATHGGRRPDKGHSALMARVLGACRGNYPFEPGVGAGYAAQSVALAALEAIASGAPCQVIDPPQAEGASRDTDR